MLLHALCQPLHMVPKVVFGRIAVVPIRGIEPTRKFRIRIFIFENRRRHLLLQFANSNNAEFRFCQIGFFVHFVIGGFKLYESTDPKRAQMLDFQSGFPAFGIVKPC